ncbi:MAG: SDR family oxidoreductase [Atopobiaceae bacterium]|nr:SDR family oxidoreductase [Atopobiaceae bacterium]
MRVVVSGTSQGIGLAIAQEFLAAGHDVLGYDVLDAAIVHPRYQHRKADIRDVERQAEDDPNILVCNAGTLDEETALDVNLIGTMHFAEQFVSCPSLRSILFVASASARNGAEFPRYVASKAGIVGYMKNLALSVASRGITCNSISPGGVVTPANDHILKSDELYAQVKAETLLGKWAEAQEIAELAYFLTVRNRSITGEDILIDNGEMLKSNFIW